MPKKLIRAGIVGSGFAANFHYNAIQRVNKSDVLVVGAYSTNKSRLSGFTTPKGIEAYSSLGSLINDSDVLHVCTPPESHEKITLEVLKMGKFAIIEKPFTGYFGDDSSHFNGDTFPREIGLAKVIESTNRMLNAEKESIGAIMYAENWVYAPAIQKERELIEKTGAQILWIQGQQSHSGSHSESYGIWRLSGGGSLIGKGSHPIAAALYLKRVEGKTRNKKAIRPKTVSARTHAITRMPSYENLGHLRDLYTDVEDYASVHIVFEDGTIADIVASELVQGGVKNHVEVHANNHRTVCNIAPNNSILTFNPLEEYYDNIYVVEKTGTKQGWSFMSPDEAWFNGYQNEMDAFYSNVSEGSSIESDSRLATDVLLTIYAAYLSASKKGIEIEIPINNN